ncbi:hypothetical protein VMCG_03334 [Cytospora schulzeri]|uniref:Uncharacterized protein n=1 Tax=Cytospora schulzeri TaxID=448051 RepID=A0A423WY52_9PEZI|nr:hypothetical protein VMCG_03334 [Valsa malicola]
MPAMHASLLNEACHRSQWEQYAANRNQFVWTVSTRSEWVSEASNMHTAASNECRQMNTGSPIFLRQNRCSLRTFWAACRVERDRDLPGRCISR